MDRVFVTALEIDAIIGVHDWERQVRQTLLVDLELATDAARAAAHDELTDAIDYSAVAARATALVQQGEFRLIESAAVALAELLQREFGPVWLRVRVSKPGALPEAGAVGVCIERGRREDAC